MRDFGKATGGTSIESEFCNDGKYKVISIGSYSENSKYTDQGIRADKTKKTESKILNKNDLTMILNDKTSSGNIIGRVLLIDVDDTYVYNQRTERIEVYKNDFEPEFLYQLLNADNIREKIVRSAQGNTQIYVNWTSISEINYAIPKSKEEQKKIARYFTSLDHLITLHQRKQKLLKNHYFYKNFHEKHENNNNKGEDTMRSLKLYHGSNVAVREPKLFPTARALDFGAGFYLTTSYEQAKKWAELMVKRRRTGVPTVSVYEVNEEQWSELSVLKFNAPNVEWLKFVSANRRNQHMEENWDVVVGPVANDNTMPVINLYLKGSYDEEEALKRLLPQKLKDQYAFKTEKAISKLQLCEVIMV